MTGGPIYRSTVNLRPTTFALGTRGLEVHQRKWLRTQRGFIRYDDIIPEYTVTRTDDHRHIQGLLVLVIITLVAVVVTAAKVYGWGWIRFAGPPHWYSAGCVALLGVMIGTWLLLRHRGPEVRYRFSGRHPFVIGGRAETKDDLDIFVNLLQQRIWDSAGDDDIRQR